MSPPPYHDFFTDFMNTGYNIYLDIFLTFAILQDGATTPLIEAARRGRTDVVRLLLDRGASIDFRIGPIDTYRGSVGRRYARNLRLE